MELHEFHIGERGTGFCRERDPLAEIAHRIGGCVVKPADATSGEHHLRGRQNGGSIRGRAKQAGDLLAVHHNPPRLETFEH